MRKITGAKSPYYTGEWAAKGVGKNSP